MANMRDGFSGFMFYQALPPQDLTAGGMNGVTIDRRGYQTCTFVVNVGACTSAGAMTATEWWKLMIEHASVSTAGTIDAWSEIYPSQMLHSVVGEAGAYSGLDSGCFQSITSNTQASTVFFVGYVGNRRYVRLRISDTSVPSIFSVGAICILGNPEVWPVTEPVGADGS